MSQCSFLLIERKGEVVVIAFPMWVSLSISILVRSGPSFASGVIVHAPPPSLRCVIDCVWMKSREGGEGSKLWWIKLVSTCMSCPVLFKCYEVNEDCVPSVQVFVIWIQNKHYSKFSHCCGQLLLPDPAGSKAVLVFADCFRYCVRLEIVAVPHEGRWPSIIHIILLMVMIV